MSIMLLLLGLLLFVFLVVAHEFGHYIAARRGGVEVEEFGIGFPPRAWSKRLKNKTLLTINWLPLGGFVKLKGEHDADTTKGSFGAASLERKVKIMLAGVGMNLAVAFFLLTVLAVVGMPRLIENQFTVASDTKITKNDVLVGYIEPNSPAQQVGLRTKDQLVSVDRYLDNAAAETTRVGSADQLVGLTKSLAGQKVQLTIRRADQTLVKTLSLRSQSEVEASKKTAEPKGYLGVSPTELTLQRSTWSAPIVASGLIKQFTVATFKGLWQAISGLAQGNGSKASAQVSGPVGVFVLLKDGSLLGYQFVLVIIAIISLTLAIMNVLPIPALDGGRLFVTLLYRIRNKPLTQKIEDRIHGTGFAVLMLLFVLITIVDVRRFW
ncbi:MAG TPA: M50 family metallopeptidase [Candidatus Saccharibacteria bacterium]|nr:M50 family metallopeptidase [Candidatus Saccharibacteria bacterium]